MKWWAVQAVVAVWVVTATGCLSPRTDSQPMHTYQLALDGATGEPRLADINGPVLLVSLAQSEPGFDTPRMAYLKRAYEVEYYAQNQWADTPARMFTPALSKSLVRSGAWRAVIPLPASVRGDFRLDSYGLAVQQEFMQQPSRVRAAVRMQLIDLKESRIVGTRTFEVMEDAPSNDAYGGVLAANRAMATMLDQVGSWLQACVRRASECGRS